MQGEVQVRRCRYGISRRDYLARGKRKARGRDTSCASAALSGGRNAIRYLNVMRARARAILCPVDYPDNLISKILPKCFREK